MRDGIWLTGRANGGCEARTRPYCLTGRANGAGDARMGAHLPDRAGEWGLESHRATGKIRRQPFVPDPPVSAASCLAAITFDVALSGPGCGTKTASR